MIEKYLLVKASRYFGCEPWILEQKPSYWRNLALVCEQGEIKAQNRMK